MFSDLQLIWANCKSYNVSGSDIYKLAENMERRCKKLIRELRTALKLDNPQAEGGDLPPELEEAANKSVSANEEEEDDFGYDPERYVPFDEKVEFADMVKRVTKEGLTQIVVYLKEKQAEAVDD